MNAELLRHPKTDCPAAAGIGVDLSWHSDGRLELVYTLAGDLAGLRIPAPGASGRRDGLWRHTCFEAFVMAEDGPAYREFNFSPSGEWAAYCFAGYREDGADLAMAAPALACRQEAGRLELTAQLPAAALPAGARLRLGLSAVIEDTEGKIGYWALHHPPGRPDFHHTYAFALLLSRP